MADDLIETGLAGLTVAVTTEPEVIIPVPAAPAYTKAPLPDGWTLNKVAALVREIAQSMYDLPDILRRHSLTEPQYKSLCDNEFFKRALEQFTIDWNSAANTQKRLALEAAIAIEDALPTVAARMHKPTEPLADVVMLLKVLAEMAGTIGVKAAQQPVAPSEKFKIIINLGGDIVQREASVSPLPPSPPVGQGGDNPLRALMEAAGMSSPLQKLREGS